MCGSSYRFQNRTVTTRFAVVPTDFKIKLANQICGSSHTFKIKLVTTRFVGVSTDFVFTNF
ncbi:hypothetical protein C5473_18685 [Leptospira interrogans serovar Weerasinghe]|nr:hypothetical protein C5473_21875 [Leptospira interrogans serovar Weerasinghe]KAA1269987.1 hypothetical protein C5473_18685 [Leptospira interrogans serovar Weerasinghe]